MECPRNLSFLRFVFVFGSLMPAGSAVAQPATPPSVHVEPAPNADAFSDSVGATPGQFRVDESGAATYTIPIVVPAGTAGVAPKLSLDYNARGGWGPLGPGWALGGQSAITRCKRSTEHGDGAGPHPGINFDSDPENDAYCLDGQRLLKRGSGFGACPAFGYPAGQEFSPELDPAARVCGYQSAAAAPGFDRWLAYPKDGSVRRFGTAGNSKLAPLDGDAPSATGGNTMTWAMDRLYDATGNYIDFEYIRNNPNGELNLGVVRWTGKVAVTSAAWDPVTGAAWNPFTATTTRTPFARASMLYEVLSPGAERVDYLGGATLRSSVKLRRIDLFGPANSGGTPNSEVAVRSYRLDYAQAVTGSRADRLVSVQECADTPTTTCFVPQACTGATPATCYPATRFTWNAFGVEDFSQGFDAPAVAQNADRSLNYAVDYKVGDVNGDGRQDIVFIKDRSCSGNGPDQNSAPGSMTRFRFVTSLGASPPQGLQTPRNSAVFPVRTPPPGESVPSCTDSGPATNFSNNARIRWDTIWHLYDLTGDGRDDLILQYPKTVQGGAGFGWGVFRTVQAQPNGPWVFEDTPIDLGIDTTTDGDSRLADFSGDGLPDLWHFTNSELRCGFCAGCQRDRR